MTASADLFVDTLDNEPGKRRFQITEDGVTMCAERYNRDPHRWFMVLTDGDGEHLIAGDMRARSASPSPRDLYMDCPVTIRDAPKD